MADNTLLEKVLSLQDKYQSLQDQLSSPDVMSDMKKFVQLNKDYKELEPIIKAGLEYKMMLDELASAKDILMNEKDEDLREDGQHHSCPGSGMHRPREAGGRICRRRSAAGRNSARDQNHCRRENGVCKIRDK